MNNIEILAPVGNIEMLYAALSAGADSFYMALDDFGARAYAENFDIVSIKEVIDYVHLFNKKVFITINTLIKDQEIKKALYYIEKLYEYGTDAILVQDIGLFSLIKDKIPQLEIHASTQMAVRDYYGAKALMNLGYDRIVIARETPFEEIKKIATLNVDTEVFVHGSLCVSFSGECLMSSFLGKRSANRGRCAGACRKKYELVSDKKVLDNDYFLNMNDLNTINHVDKLIEAGVDSLKIEGRMKSPEYVYTIVKNYKNQIEKNFYNKDDLQDISNRAYTEGFIFGQKRDYITLEKSKKRRAVGLVEENKNKKYFIANSQLLKGTNLEVTTEKGKRLPLTLTQDYKPKDIIELEKYPDAKVSSEILILNSYKLTRDLNDALASYRNLPIDIKFEAKIGQKPKINIFYRDKKITYVHNILLEEAKKVSISKDEVRENLTKLNDEIFKANSIDIEMDKKVFIRKKDINECRRQALSELKKDILKKYLRKPVKILERKISTKKSYKREINIELLNNNVSVENLREYDNIYIRDYDKRFEGLSLYYVLDSHLDYDIKKLISFLKDNKIKGVIFNNYRDLNFIDDFKENEIEIRIGRYLNVFNQYAFDFYRPIASKICSSVENDFKNINYASINNPVELLAYGPIELMTMVHCPFSSIKKCGLKGCKTCKFKIGQIRDDEGNIFDVRRYDGYSKIYSSKYLNIDKNKINKNVSLLYLVSNDKDFKNISSKVENLNYERGVL